MKLKNSTYDVLKYIALIALPAIATLYGALAQIWGLPYGDKITMSITAVCTCLGVLLKISTDNYNKETNDE